MRRASLVPAAKSKNGTANTGKLAELALNVTESLPSPKTRSPKPTVCVGVVKKPMSARPPACMFVPERPPPNSVVALGRMPAVVEDSVAGSVVTSGGRSCPCRHHRSTSKRAQTIGLEQSEPQSQPPPAPPQGPHAPQPLPHAPQPLPHAPPSMVPPSGPPPPNWQVPSGSPAGSNTGLW